MNTNTVWLIVAFVTEAAVVGAVLRNHLRETRKRHVKHGPWLIRWMCGNCGAHSPYAWKGTLCSECGKANHDIRTVRREVTLGRNTYWQICR